MFGRHIIKNKQRRNALHIYFTKNFKAKSLALWVIDVALKVSSTREFNIIFRSITALYITLPIRKIIISDQGYFGNQY